MLITPDYQKQQEALHAVGNYGTTAKKYGETVSQMADMMEYSHLLDYGCGSNRSLMETLKPERSVKVQCYDPGVPEYADPPTPAEFVVCIDVLEHIEPHLIDDVLDHLAELTQEMLFATVSTRPAGKVLPDGRNAHLIQQPPEWWLPLFMERWKMQGFHQRVSGFEVILLSYDYDKSMVNGDGK